MKSCIAAIPEIKEMVEKAKEKGFETPHTRFPNQFPEDSELFQKEVKISLLWKKAFSPLSLLAFSLTQ